MAAIAALTAVVFCGSPAAAQDEPAALGACAACHGANGLSVAPDIPNLAGQRQRYLERQLKAFRKGDRHHEVMSAIAGQLDDAAIVGLSSYFAGQPDQEEAALSALPAEIAETRVTLPENYAESFTYYMTLDFPQKKQIRRFFANGAAALAAKNGEAMPPGAYFLVEVSKAKEDADGNLVKNADGQLAPDGILFYWAMETGDGWGAAFPELLRNGDWNYRVFSKDLEPKENGNQALCLACHKTQAKDGYLFSLDRLRDVLTE
jgi:cytochrome c553